MKDLAVVMLAAGQGKRMKSERAKVLHPVLGQPLIYYSLAAAAELRPSRLVVVVGVQAEAVEAAVLKMRPDLPGGLKGAVLKFARQKEQKGTAHAVMSALPALKGFRGQVVVLYGDAPLIRAQTLKKLVSFHRKEKADLSLITVEFSDPTGYGRILRGKDGRLLGIVEERDCTPEQRRLRESNPGFYCYEMEFLRRALPRVGNQNQQAEYYLTDLVQIAVEDQRKVAGLLLEGEAEFLGVNSRWELARVEALLKERINQAHCLAGVSMEMPETIHIGPLVEMGRDTTLEPGVRLMGKTRLGPACQVEANARILDSALGPGCVVEANARIERCKLGARVRIKAGSVLEESEVEDGAQVGPMAHLRPGSVIGKDARLGNFVEIKKARIGEGTKISHLTYVGDAVIGRNVNLGCGFITCNYDGEHKYLTVIEDDVFVGSDTQTVAPVKIGKGAYIGSGSTITQDVPAGALALTRAPQVVKEGWVKKRKARSKEEARKKKRAEKRMLGGESSKPE